MCHEGIVFHTLGAIKEDKKSAPHFWGMLYFPYIGLNETEDDAVSLFRDGRVHEIA